VLDLAATFGGKGNTTRAKNKGIEWKNGGFHEKGERSAKTEGVGGHHVSKKLKDYFRAGGR